MYRIPLRCTYKSIFKNLIHFDALYFFHIAKNVKFAALYKQFYLNY